MTGANRGQRYDQQQRNANRKHCYLRVVHSLICEDRL
jgi:hypothetical protein